jgi:hypothetical protein
MNQSRRFTPRFPLLGRRVGKRITSRMEAASVRSMTRRSTPIPTPPVGGMPYSIALR